MISLFRRFVEDESGFCSVEYALTALIGVTIALWVGYNLQLKTANALASTHKPLLDIVSAQGGPPACKS